jgi:hypothetical protein
MIENRLRFICAYALLAGTMAAAPIAVGTRLSLVIDVSDSVDASEYALQMSGYGAAFRNALNQSLIINQGGIAVNYVFFASSATTASPWNLLNDVASINSFATMLESLPRVGGLGGLTNIATGMDQSVASFADATYTSSRKVMDVSGDGEANEGGEPFIARNGAAAQGIVINGLTIGDATLTAYYASNVITSGGFVESVSDFNGFANAIQRKLFRELSTGEVPEPSGFVLMGAGLMGVAYWWRRAR